MRKSFRSICGSVAMVVLAGCGTADESVTPPAAPPAASDTTNAVAAKAPPASVDTETGAATPAIDSMPQDVESFRARRDDCDHLRGEEAYDATRSAELKVLLEQSCKGTDQALTALRRKYESDDGILKVLQEYDDTIE